MVVTLYVCNAIFPVNRNLLWMHGAILPATCTIAACVHPCNMLHTTLHATCTIAACVHPCNMTYNIARNIVSNMYYCSVFPPLQHEVEYISTSTTLRTTIYVSQLRAMLQGWTRCNKIISNIGYYSMGTWCNIACSTQCYTVCPYYNTRKVISLL